ncbi:MAG: serine hydrolase [Wenzhouxiangella sp.]|nr:serine hydrolase [Wenzhouxiangella sp.]
MNRFLLATLALGLSLCLTPVSASDHFAEQADALLSEIFADDGPGAAVVVSREGEVIFNRAYGRANVELGVPMQPTHIFRLASVTKQFAAAGLLALVDDGEVALDDPLSKFLPDYPVGDVTIHQLLNHTSGIRSYTGIPGYMSSERIRADLTTEELVAVFADEPVDFAPGEDFAYNNSGYVLAGAVIEAVTGKAWNDFLRERFFEPHGMDSIDAYSDTAIVPMRVAGYQGSAEDFENAPFISMTQPHAAGALSATAMDVDRWQQHLHGGDLLSVASYRAMLTADEVAADTQGGQDYGYGLVVGEWFGQPVYHHGGGINGFVTHALWLPEPELSVVVLSNLAGGVQAQDVSLQLVGLAMDRPYARNLPTADWPDADRLAVQGTYRIDENTTRTIRVEDGQIISQRQGGPAFAVRPVADDRLAFENSLSTFEIERDDNGEVVAVYLQSGFGGEGERAERISAEVQTRTAIDVDPAQLERLVGDYELQPGFVISVSVVEGGLQVQATGQPAIPVSAESPVRFYNETVGFEIEFALPEDGTATQLTLFQGGQVMPAPRVEGN